MFNKIPDLELDAAKDDEDTIEYLAQKKRLFETPPYEPKRSEIELPNDNDGFGWASGIKERRWGFKFFDRFDSQINSIHQADGPFDIGPWQIEQRSDPYLKKFGIGDGPVIGLRYVIYYNSEQIGNLEIHPHSEPSPENGKDELDYVASIRVIISCAPLIPHDHLSSFLRVCTARFLSVNYAPNKDAAVLSALTATLWETNRKNSIWVDLDFIFTGLVKLEHELS